MRCGTGREPCRRPVEMPLDAGSNVEVPEQDGKTALMLAARGGLGPCRAGRPCVGARGSVAGG